VFGSLEACRRLSGSKEEERFREGGSLFFFRLGACHERLNLLAVEHGRQKTLVLETTLQKDGRFLGVQSGAVEYIQLKLLFLP
jgi:hypothetical protein